MAKAKTVKLNESYIRGEVLNIINPRRVFEGETYEKIAYTLKVEVAENETRDVECFMNVYDANGDESKKSRGAMTIANEIKTRAESGTGDMVNCACKVVSNNYYNKGKLIEGFKLDMEYCNREEKGKPIEKGTFWRTLTLVQSIEDKGEYIELKGLINEYCTSRSVRGHEMTFRINELELAKEINASRNEFLAENPDGDFVVMLEGLVSEKSTFITVAEDELEHEEEVASRGFGSAKASAEKKNEAIRERNKKRDKMREDGGKYITEYFLEVTGGEMDIPEIEEYPFTEDRLTTVLENIASNMEKSKEKDMAKNGGDLPF